MFTYGICYWKRGHGLFLVFKKTKGIQVKLSENVDGIAELNQNTMCA
jgi:hypothetical protein